MIDTDKILRDIGQKGFGSPNSPASMAAQFGASLIPSTDKFGNVKRGGMTASSALQGAGMGAQFGPWGAAAGAVIGGVTGFIQSGKLKNEQEAQDRLLADVEKKNFMETSRSILSSYPRSGVNVSGFYRNGGDINPRDINQFGGNSFYKDQFFSSWNNDPKIKNFRSTFQKSFGYDPNPLDKESKYNYVKAVLSGSRPELDSSDNLYHWDSKFKDDDHPNRFVNGKDTKKSFKQGGNVDFNGSGLDRFNSKGGSLVPIAEGISIAKGNTHENGGIDLYDGAQNFAEVEDGEVIHGTRVFSDTLKVPDYVLQAFKNSKKSRK